jgi:Na+-driven multidrug efflux pump
MVAGFVATGVNLCFNYVLIFGHFGIPQLGVAGAAIATVIARFTEMFIVVGWAHAHTKILPFLKGLYRSVYIPAPLLKSIILKGMPLLVNELGYGLGMAVLNQCYSVCGLAVLPALSISTTIYNLGSVVYRSLGNTVGIITGQMLGASLPEKEVRDSNRKMTAFGVMTGVVFGALLIALSGIIPKAYNTTDEVRNLATWFIIISSCAMPLQAYIFPVYFTLRSGGKTMITLAFDCGANWLLAIPIAFVLSRFTALPILVIFSICHSIDIPKCLFGLWLIKRGTWIQNITVN